jgi:hypothetical protein
MARPLVLDATEVVDVVPPLSAPGLTVEALHVVAQATPAPTLVDGRPT